MKKDLRKSKWPLAKRMIFFLILLIFITSISLFTDKTFAQTEDLLNKHYNLGKVYYQKGEFLEARREFQEVLSFDPRHKWSKLYLKRIEERLGISEEEAPTTKEKTISTVEPTETPGTIDAQAVKTHYNQGKRFFEQGDYRSAKEEFEEVLSLYPGHIYAQRYLVESKQKLSREKELTRIEELRHRREEERRAKIQTTKRETRGTAKKEAIRPEGLKTARREKIRPRQKVDLTREKETKGMEAERVRRRQLEKEEKELLARLREYKEAKEKKEKGKVQVELKKERAKWQVRQEELEVERARLLAKLEEYKKAEEREGDLRQKFDERLKKEGEVREISPEIEVGAAETRPAIENLAEEELKLRQQIERYEQAKREKQERLIKEAEESLETERERRQKAEGKLTSLQERINSELRTQIAKYEGELKLGQIEEHLIKGKENYNQADLAAAKEEFQTIINIEPEHKEATKYLALIEKAEEEIRRKEELAKLKAQREEEARLKQEEKARREAQSKAQLEAERLAKEEAKKQEEAELKAKRQEDTRLREERLKQETEEKARREEEQMRLRAQREEKLKAKREEETRKKEEARLKTEQEKEERLKRLAEEKTRREEEERIKKEELAKLKVQREEELRLKREEDARKKEEARLKAEKEKEERLKRIAEEKAKREEERRLKAEEEARLKEERLKQEAEEKARREEEQMRLRAQREEELRLKREEEARKKEEARLKAEQKKEEKLKKEAEKRAITEAEKFLKEEKERKKEEELIRLQAEKEAADLKKEAEKAKLEKIRHLYDEGKRCFKEGKYEEAIAKFEEVIKLEGNPRILYTPYAKEYVEEAKEKVEESQDKEKKEIEEIKKKAEEEKELAKRKIEEKQLRDLIRQAKRLHRQGKFEEAIPKYEEALEKDPYNDKLAQYLRRARSRLALEEKEELAEEEEVSDKEMEVEAMRTAIPPREREEKKEEITPIVEIPEIRKKLKTPVTTDFRDVDLSYVLNYLSEATGVNIVTSASVQFEKHKVTIQLKDMPLEYALKYILKAQGLTYRVEEEAVWVTTPSDLDKEETETRVYFLKKGVGLFAEFTALGAGGTGLGGAGGISQTSTLKDILEKAVSWPKDSKIVLDERTGALVITNTPSNFKIIEELLYSLDISPVQVLIEARFLEVVVNDIANLGIEWKLTSAYDINKKEAGDGTKGPGVQLAKDSGVDFSAFSRASEGLNLSFQGVLSNAKFEAVLHALEESKKTKTLSAPRITTLNNQEASIRVVDEWIYPTRYEFQVVQSDKNGDGDFNDAGETTYKNVPLDFVRRDVGILLRVVPSVGADKKTITLALIPEVSEAVKDYFEYTGDVKLPKFTSRNLSTSVIVDNGDTVVLGGLIKEARTKTRTKVPLLGDLPLLGVIFRKDSDDIERKNLLIFVTAKILSPSGEEVVP